MIENDTGFNFKLKIKSLSKKVNFIDKKLVEINKKI